MRIFSDEVEITDSEGVFYARVKFDAVISWYLYPQIFVRKTEYLSIPSVGSDGLCYISIPHKQQKDWFLRCFLSYSRFKRLILLPYFANLHHYFLVGRFANGSYSPGVKGVLEFNSEN